MSDTEKERARIVALLRTYGCADPYCNQGPHCPETWIMEIAKRIEDGA